MIKSTPKRYWNYRMVRHLISDSEYYAVHEAYYDNDKVVAISKEPSQPYGDTIQDLLGCLDAMITSCHKHPAVLDADANYPGVKEMAYHEAEFKHTAQIAGLKFNPDYAMGDTDG